MFFIACSKPIWTLSLIFSIIRISSGSLSPFFFIVACFSPSAGFRTVMPPSSRNALKFANVMNPFFCWSTIVNTVFIWCLFEGTRRNSIIWLKSESSRKPNCFWSKSKKSRSTWSLSRSMTALSFSRRSATTWFELTDFCSYNLWASTLARSNSPICTGSSEKLLITWSISSRLSPVFTLRMSFFRSLSRISLGLLALGSVDAVRNFWTNPFQLSFLSRVTACSLAKAACWSVLGWCWASSFANCL